MDASDAASHMGMEVRDLYCAIDQGRIPAFQMNGSIRLRRHDVEARADTAGIHQNEDTHRPAAPETISPLSRDATLPAKASPPAVPGKGEHPEAKALAARLDAVRAELLAAGDDFTRLRIRDESRAVTAAAAVLKRRDIEVEASMLCCDAEREIVKHNPPIAADQGAVLRDNPTSEMAQQRKELIGLLGSTVRLRMLRRAHAHFDDDEYQRIKAEHRARREPLHRSTLLRYAGDHSTGQHPKDGKRKDHDVRLQVLLTQPEYRRLRVVADQHGWSDTQALREAIRRLVAEESSKPGDRPAATAQAEDTSGPPRRESPRPSLHRTKTEKSVGERSTTRPKRTPRPRRSAPKSSPKPGPASRSRDKAKNPPSATPAQSTQQEGSSTRQDEPIRLRPVLPSDMGGGAYADLTS